MSINAKVRQLAKATGRPAAELHREFYLFRFLGRVFLDPDSPWVLKGGSGLLVRITDGARHSRDADLLRLDVDATQAVVELQQLCDRASDLDPFIFEIQRGKNDPGTSDAAQLIATVYLGATRVHTFPVDLSIRTTLASDIDRVAPRTILQIPDIADLPRFRCLSLADQVADKVAAMYEIHGTDATPSTRWHDLVDLLLIIRRFPLDAAKTTSALHIQQQRRARLDLPAAITSPGPQWEAGYHEEARSSSLPPELHRLDAALSALAQCLNPLLDQSVAVGTWDATTSQWNTHPEGES
ncbi:nucleotidyl transferase AbiEii/AbiGii toxin family protein [Nocardia sp. BMG51109]|uniref:nucleotidyl transferase AbiEii/AbiGii toxin family protein n=1 Tax=Nocardia sp. BMG51109 TaxID=1056816 RepID=UPI0004676D00|nr:nucleotidyl transferase AbiEii/AbiGii toxin family protein [Nocardia sp. BMG51109]